jgi:iron complex transport system substrate-binding protein
LTLLGGRHVLTRPVRRRSLRCPGLRSPLPGVVLAVLLLAACTGGSIEATGTSAPPTRQQIPGSELPEGRGLVAEELDGTRTVTSAWGTVAVPLEPKRVVSVAGDIDFEAMLALGIAPVGAGTPNGVPGEPFAPHVADLAKGVEPLAWADGVPLEEIAALEPDLIFAPDERMAAQLSEIAPTVPRGSWVGTDWKQDFRYVAAVLGQDEAAAERLSEWEHRATEVYASIAESMEGRTVASPQITDGQGDVRVDPPDAFSSAVLLELGLDLAPVAREASDEAEVVSPHQLSDLDADVLFWQVEPGPAGGLELARSNPQWSSLPAVQAGAVYEVDDRPWDSPTILGAERILDDVAHALT